MIEKKSSSKYKYSVAHIKRHHTDLPDGEDMGRNIYSSNKIQKLFIYIFSGMAWNG